MFCNAHYKINHTFTAINHFTTHRYILLYDFFCQEQIASHFITMPKGKKKDQGLSHSTEESPVTNRKSTETNSLGKQPFPSVSSDKELKNQQRSMHKAMSDTYGRETNDESDGNHATADDPQQEIPRRKTKEKDTFFYSDRYIVKATGEERTSQYAQHGDVKNVVYLITDRRNGEQYVGMTTMHIQERMNKHFSTGTMNEHCKENGKSNIRKKDMQVTIVYHYNGTVSIENSKLVDGHLLKVETKYINEIIFPQINERKCHFTDKHVEKRIELLQANPDGFPHEDTEENANEKIDDIKADEYANAEHTHRHIHIHIHTHRHTYPLIDADDIPHAYDVNGNINIHIHTNINI